MTKKYELETMKWVRFSDYYVTDNGMIRPTPDAVPTAYDPWDGYRRATLELRRGFTTQPHDRASIRG